MKKVLLLAACANFGHSEITTTQEFIQVLAGHSDAIQHRIRLVDTSVIDIDLVSHVDMVKFNRSELDKFISKLQATTGGLTREMVFEWGRLRRDIDLSELALYFEIMNYAKEMIAEMDTILTDPDDMVVRRI
ncbi:MAG: hypothetical protein LBQ43_02045, partial [Holosporales bacterium]|nr:hypothetical protein [Holosporales bacterium]